MDSYPPGLDAERRLAGRKRVGSGWDAADDEMTVRSRKGVIGIGDDVDVGSHFRMVRRRDGDHQLRRGKGATLAGLEGRQSEREGRITGGVRLDAKGGGKTVGVGEVNCLAGHGSEHAWDKTAAELGEDDCLRRWGEFAVRKSGRDPDEDSGRLDAATAVLPAKSVAQQGFADGFLVLAEGNRLSGRAVDGDHARDDAGR